MKLETQKIIGKEILFFVSSLILTFLVWLSLTVYNEYDIYHLDNLKIKINQENILIDSLNIPYKTLISKLSKKKKQLFHQYGGLKGGLGKDEYIITPFRQNLKLEQKLGEEGEIPSPFELFGGKELFVEKIFKKNPDEKDPYFKYEKYRLKKDNEFITEKVFYDSLELSSSFRSMVYNELKNVYSYSNCPTLTSFEEMIGIPIPKDILKLNEEIKIHQNKFNELKIEYNSTQEKLVNGIVIFNETKMSFLILILILFVFRYLFLSVKWSITVLKK